MRRRHRVGGEILDDPTTGVVRPGPISSHSGATRYLGVFDVAAVFRDGRRVVSDGVVLAPTPLHSADTVAA